MTKDSLLPDIKVNDVNYRHVKNRLAGGRIYRATDGESYLRIGDKQLTAEEHIHLLSLCNRGFPVAKILNHGKRDEEYYFIEESLGEEPFALQFGEEFSDQGVISDKTFERYLGVMQRYAEASFDPKNHRHHKFDIRQISLLKYIQSQYSLNTARLDRLFTKAEKRLAELPSVEIHEDLGPFNVMDRGVIDFETVQDKSQTLNSSRFGPVGFDSVAGPLTGYYFPRAEGYHIKILYEFSNSQLADLGSMISKVASTHNIPNPNDYSQEFLLIRTLWAAARRLGYEVIKYDNPEQERFWSEFRSNILHHVIDYYEQDKVIDPRNFPDIGVSGKW